MNRDLLREKVAKVLKNVSVTVDTKPTGEPVKPHQFYPLDGIGLERLLEALLEDVVDLLEQSELESRIDELVKFYSENYQLIDGTPVLSPLNAQIKKLKEDNKS